MSGAESLPYWLVNVPREKWPAECPEYLQNLSDKDVKHLAIRDQEYHWLTWEEVSEIVATNRLEALFRLPSELRRYRWYCWKLEREHGSIMNFMLSQRLKWAHLTPEKSEPFACEDDYKILLNDWPYGIDQRIVHIVIWTKTPFKSDTDTGNLTPHTKDLIEDFVQSIFGSAIEHDKLIWFANPASLRSVHAIEHFHVMLLDPDPKFVARLTNNDIPSSKVGSVASQDDYLLNP